MQKITDSHGYTSYLDSESGESVYQHQLAALASGFDPCEVFGDDVEVHHLLGVPGSLGAKVDVPAGVVPVDPATHREVHTAPGPYCRLTSVISPDGEEEQAPPAGTGET